MIRVTFFTILLTAFFYSCSNTGTNETQIIKAPSFPSFKSFEISYADGGKSIFSFMVDTNKIYFFPKKWDITKYGILPDTIFKLFDTTFLKIRNDRNLKSKRSDEGSTAHSPQIAVQIISNVDTITINQLGGIDSLFFPVIKTVQKFIDNSKHQTIRASVLFATDLTPPPPKIKIVKFEPPKTIL